MNSTETSPKRSSEPAVVNGKRVLPEDSKEAEAKVKPYKLYGRALVNLVDAVFVWLIDDKLDEQEKEEGTFAFSALLYEEAPTLGARFLVLAWILAISVPRGGRFLSKRKVAALKQIKADEAGMTRVDNLKKEMTDLVPVRTSA